MNYFGRVSYGFIYVIAKPNVNICTEKKINKTFLLALHPDSLLQLDVVISVSKVLRRLIFATFAKPLKNSKYSQELMPY